MSAHAKSVAMIALDCDLMNSDHVGPVRSRVGSIPAARRIFQKVDAASWWPSRASSPWMRLIPSSGSRAREANGNASDLGVIWRASSGRGWRLGPVPCDESLVPSHGTVSGLTIRNVVFRCVWSSPRLRRARIVLSVSLNRGRSI